MVKIKQEPPSPAAAEPTTKKRIRTSSREASAASAAAAAAEVVVKSEVKTEAEAEAGLKKEDGDVGDGAGLLAKLKASWATLDTTSTASEESPCAWAGMAGAGRMRLSGPPFPLHFRRPTPPYLTRIQLLYMDVSWMKHRRAL